MQRWGQNLLELWTWFCVCKTKAEVVCTLHFNANPPSSSSRLFSSAVSLGLTSRGSWLILSTFSKSFFCASTACNTRLSIWLRPPGISLMPAIIIIQRNLVFQTLRSLWPPCILMLVKSAGCITRADRSSAPVLPIQRLQKKVVITGWLWISFLFRKAERSRKYFQSMCKGFSNKNHFCTAVGA